MTSSDKLYGVKKCKSVDCFQAKCTGHGCMPCHSQLGFLLGQVKQALSDALQHAFFAARAHNLAGAVQGERRLDNQRKEESTLVVPGRGACGRWTGRAGRAGATASASRPRRCAWSRWATGSSVLVRSFFVPKCGPVLDGCTPHALPTFFNEHGCLLHSLGRCFEALSTALCRGLSCSSKKCGSAWGRPPPTQGRTMYLESLPALLVLSIANCNVEVLRLWRQHNLPVLTGSAGLVRLHRSASTQPCTCSALPRCSRP